MPRVAVPRSSLARVIGFVLVLGGCSSCSPVSDQTSAVATPTSVSTLSPDAATPAATPSPGAVSTPPTTLPPSPPLRQLWSATAAGTPLDVPDGVAFDASGNVYALDSGNNRVVKLDPAGTVLTTWGRFGRAAGEFDCASICMIAVDRAGRVLVTDQGNARVQVFDADGRTVDAWGTFGSAEGELNRPFGIATDRDGNVYVGDGGNHRVQKFSPDGTPLLVFGSAGTTAGHFSEEMADLAIDAAGTIYVTDRRLGAHRFDAEGRYLGALGGCGDGTDLTSATGIAIDGDDNLFVFDLQAGRLCRFDRDRQPVAWWDAAGTPDGSFDVVGGVAVGPKGAIAVGELFDDRVRVFAQP